MARRVVITGMGTVNPLSSDLGQFWQALLEGRSGIGPIDLFDPSPFKVRFAGQVRNFQPETILDARTARRLDRFDVEMRAHPAHEPGELGHRLDRPGLVVGELAGHEARPVLGQESLGRGQIEDARGGDGQADRLGHGLQNRGVLDRRDGDRSAGLVQIGRAHV